MALVLIMAAGLWGIGAVMGLPHRTRWGLIGILWLAVVGSHLLLPAGHALRLATGNSAAPWLLLAGAGALIAIYAVGLRRLRARAASRAAPQVGEPHKSLAQPGRFSEAELERYARHMVLREIGGPGQRRLREARVLVVGAGGLGSPALMYLAASGVGTLGIIDHDGVDYSNLQRQIIHIDSRVHMPKVHSAAESLRALNPYVTIRPYHRRLTPEIAADLFAEYDLILDGTDNFDTRYLSNSVATELCKPLISGALSQWEGQVALFDPARGGPCYRCVFPEPPDPALAPSCAEAGVLSPLTGVIGAMMAVEAVKLIAGAGTPLRGKMLIYDALHGETRLFNLSRRLDCPVCHGVGGPTGDTDEPASV